MCIRDRLGTCKAKTFTELFDGVRALDWRHLLPADAAFTVTGKSALSKLGSVRDVQSISKKAIADALMAAHGYARCQMCIRDRNDAGGCCAVYFLGYADGTDADRAGMLSMQL